MEGYDIVIVLRQDASCSHATLLPQGSCGCWLIPFSACVPLPAAPSFSCYMNIEFVYTMLLWEMQCQALSYIVIEAVSGRE